MNDHRWLERMNLKRQLRQQRAAAQTALTPSATTAHAVRPQATARVAAPAAVANALIAAAVTNERDRIRGILEAPEANGREWAARSLAFSGGTTVVHARKILGELRPDLRVEEDEAARRIAGMATRRNAAART